MVSPQLMLFLQANGENVYLPSRVREARKAIAKAGDRKSIEERIELLQNESGFENGEGVVHTQLGYFYSALAAHYGEDLSALNAALNHYRIALRNSHGNAVEIIDELGCIEMRRGNFNGALEMYQEIIDEFPDRAEAKHYHHFGEAWHNLGSFSVALKNYEKAMEKDPDNFDTYAMALDATECMLNDPRYSRETKAKIGMRQFEIGLEMSKRFKDEKAELLFNVFFPPRPDLISKIVPYMAKF